MQKAAQAAIAGGQSAVEQAAMQPGTHRPTPVPPAFICFKSIINAIIVIIIPDLIRK
jgi:hypothetical protein